MLPLRWTEQAVDQLGGIAENLAEECVPLHPAAGPHLRQRARRLAV